MLFNSKSRFVRFSKLLIALSPASRFLSLYNGNTCGQVPADMELGNKIDYKPVEISQFRKPYHNVNEPYLLEENAASDPFQQFDCWFKDICGRSDVKYEEVNAVCLSTCLENKPSSRMVLLKRYDRKGFVFYTNSLSRKGKELANNPNAALLFYWPFVNRQVRVEGLVKFITVEETEKYWNSRPLPSRIGAAVSAQSTEVPSRQYLEEKRAELEALVTREGEGAVKRPDSWCGYLLDPHYFEYWQGQTDRLHDRLVYQLDNNSKWTRCRLAP